MERFIKLTPLLGRLFLTAIFLSSGLNKVLQWENTAAYMTAQGMPLVPLFLFGAIALELGGGLSVLLGWKARIGALALVVFLVPATFIFHAFWTFPEAQQQTQMIMFMKNWAILGALLIVAGNGAGPLALDNRRTAS